MAKPCIAVTMGDPAGVGPEVCLKMLGDSSLLDQCTPVVFGDVGVLRRVGQQLGLAVPRQVLSKDQWPVGADDLIGPAVLDMAAIDADSVRPGTVNRATGRASYAYIDTAIDAALAGQVDAVATGPINKEAIHAAGIRFPGHTEIFIAKTNAQRACMMQTCSELTCTFVTTHVGYREVPGLLSIQRILDVIQLSHDAILRMNGIAGKMIVCGLNPHAGENGLFGDREEERLIIPAIELARKNGIDIDGPYPPDTAFLPQRRREADCIICMYHDQGHIPLKALAFDVAVNTTIGLSIIRTSVDHGTALDIAWQGKASANSLIQAVALATRFAQP